ncbi:hypothetical protein ACFQ7O_26610 [Streptomyces sp. NPDC056485]|uniref:hypothetical protein n=1 Tax=Streptomyces sp. NPDC056485 TaxID=3345834 RepID=UPI00369A2A4D
MTADRVAEAIALTKKPTATVEDVVTLATVFFATFPIVLAVLASTVLLWVQGLRGYPTAAALTVIWVIAGLVTYKVLYPYIPVAPMPQYGGSNLWSGLARAIGWTLTPYGVILALQGLVVGAASSLTYTYLDGRRHPDRRPTP